MKAMTDLMSPEAVAEQSSLTLETVRSHKMVRQGLCDSWNWSLPRTSLHVIIVVIR